MINDHHELLEFTYDSEGITDFGSPEHQFRKWDAQNDKGEYEVVAMTSSMVVRAEEFIVESLFVMIKYLGK